MQSHCGIKLQPSKVRSIEDPMWSMGTGISAGFASDGASETSSKHEDENALEEIARETRKLAEDMKDILCQIACKLFSWQHNPEISSPHFSKSC